MSFRGIPAGNDARYTNAEKKLLQSTKFPAIFQTKVDTTKVNFQVLGAWINKRITELLGIEDEVVVELVHSLMEERYPDPKKCQITLTGFLEKSAPVFMQEFWEMMISAQESMGGIPASLLEAKKAELQSRRAMEAQISHSLGKRMARRGSPPTKSEEAQRQSVDDYERPLRMRDPERRQQPDESSGRSSHGQRDGPGRDHESNRLYGTRRDNYRGTNFTDRSLQSGRHSRSLDVIEGHVRPRATHDHRRLSPVGRKDGPRERERSTGDMPPPRGARDTSAEPSRRRRPRGRSSESTPPRRKRRDSVDSVGRRKRLRESSSSRSPGPRSESHNRGRAPVEPTTRTSPEPSSRGQSSVKDRRSSRRSNHHSPRRHRTRQSARSRASPRRRSRSQSRSRSRDDRPRRSRDKDGSRRHRSSGRRSRDHRRRTRSASSSFSSSSSRSRSRSARRRRKRRHSRDRSRSRSRSSTPPRRHSPISGQDQDRSRRSSDMGEAAELDEEAIHRESVLKAKLLRQKRMAELKKATEDESKAEAAKVKDVQVESNHAGEETTPL